MRPTCPDGRRPKSPFLRALQANLHLRHFGPRTIEACTAWVLRFIRFHRNRHPRELGEPEVVAFLTWLAVERRVAASTENQALAALLFLYEAVLGRPLASLGDFPRAAAYPHLIRPHYRRDHRVAAPA